MRQETPMAIYRHEVVYPLVGAARGAVAFETLRLARAMGSVVVLNAVLKDQDLLAHGIAHPDAAREIAEATEWLKDAKNYERKNGRDSAANRAHPFWEELRRISDARAA